MNKNITLDKILLIISILILINFAIMSLYFHMSWKDDAVTTILGVIGNITMFPSMILTPLLFIYSLYSVFKNKNFILFFICLINIIIIATT